MWGVDRAMFASNFPVDGRFISYPDLIAAYAGATQNVSETERDAFFYGNATAFYRLSGSGSSPAPAQESAPVVAPGFTSRWWATSA